MQHKRKLHLYKTMPNWTEPYKLFTPTAVEVFLLHQCVVCLLYISVLLTTAFLFHACKRYDILPRLSAISCRISSLVNVIRILHFCHSTKSINHFHRHRFHPMQSTTSPILPIHQPNIIQSFINTIAARLLFSLLLTPSNEAR